MGTAIFVAWVFQKKLFFNNEVLLVS